MNVVTRNNFQDKDTFIVKLDYILALESKRIKIQRIISLTLHCAGALVIFLSINLDMMFGENWQKKKKGPF